MPRRSSRWGALQRGLIVRIEVVIFSHRSTWHFRNLRVAGSGGNGSGIVLCVYVQYLGIRVPIRADPGSQKSAGSINEHYDFDSLSRPFL